MFSAYGIFVYQSGSNVKTTTVGIFLPKAYHKPRAGASTSQRYNGIHDTYLDSVKPAVLYIIYHHACLHIIPSPRLPHHTRGVPGKQQCVTQSPIPNPAASHAGLLLRTSRCQTALALLSPIHGDCPGYAFARSQRPRRLSVCLGPIPSRTLYPWTCLLPPLRSLPRPSRRFCWPRCSASFGQARTLHLAHIDTDSLAENRIEATRTEFPHS